jgi:antitoxin (DNA-binding transcriptional repressor) of toxin-antitoxin stability system
MSAIAIDISELDITVKDLLARLQRDPEIIITASHQPVAKLTAVSEPAVEAAAMPKRRQAGQSDSIVWISPDFDEPLEDFKEYMP